MYVPTARLRTFSSQNNFDVDYTCKVLPACCLPQATSAGELRPSGGSTTSIGNRFHPVLGTPNVTCVDDDGAGLLYRSN